VILFPNKYIDMKIYHFLLTFKLVRNIVKYFKLYIYFRSDNSKSYFVIY